MATVDHAEPVIVQVNSDGRLALNQEHLIAADLHEGDRVLVLPLRPGLLYLQKVSIPEPPSPEELSNLMREAFSKSGYITREQVLTLIREVKNELAEE